MQSLCACHVGLGEPAPPFSMYDGCRCNEAIPDAPYQQIREGSPGCLNSCPGWGH